MSEAHTDVAIPPTDKRIWEKYKEDNHRLDEMLAR
jgi:hypothetical protein